MQELLIKLVVQNHNVAGVGGHETSCTRRQTLTKAGALLLILAAQRVEPVGAEVQYVPATIQPNLAPKQGTFDPTDEDLRDAAALLQRALNAEEVQVRHLIMLPSSPSPACENMFEARLCCTARGGIVDRTHHKVSNQQEQLGS